MSIGVIISVFLLVLVGVQFLPEIITSIDTTQNLTGSQSAILKIVPTILILGMLVYAVVKGGVDKTGA